MNDYEAICELYENYHQVKADRIVDAIREGERNRIAEKIRKYTHLKRLSDVIQSDEWTLDERGMLK